MWGTSTHNTRIERLWVEVGRQFVRAWRAFFTRLGRLHLLDTKKLHHLWLLHTLFLHKINHDCRKFQRDWNAHPISGPKTRNRSPNTAHGMYGDDDFGAVHPDTLKLYHGKSTASDGDENDWEDVGDVPADLEDLIGEHQQAQVRHDPIAVPENTCPFPGHMPLFAAALAEVQAIGDLPEGYGIRSSEWIDDAYPSYELLRSGRKRKELRISLPDSVWRPCAAEWCRALDLMNRLMYELGMENEI
ncbi:hypothetical protein HGRIS_012333 [Hohenbuehelia grisea]|uniref:Integrase core domain-containing protein n=1 Tax=Hohenbuehelia grisea TaxID=104357 RepID=A0ABR3IRX6_9AGAR